MHRSDRSATSVLAPDRPDDGDPWIPKPDVQLYRPAIRDWLNAHRMRQGHRPFPVKRCVLCPEPTALIRFEPWHPGMAFLCRHHQSQVLIMASASATRYNCDVKSVLHTLITALVHIEIELRPDVN